MEAPVTQLAGPFPSRLVVILMAVLPGVFRGWPVIYPDAVIWCRCNAVQGRS